MTSPSTSGLVAHTLSMILGVVTRRRNSDEEGDAVNPLLGNDFHADIFPQKRATKSHKLHS